MRHTPSAWIFYLRALRESEKQPAIHKNCALCLRNFILVALDFQELRPSPELT
jgi:hypothetical protein